jgi:cold shock CspA family protein
VDEVIMGTANFSSERSIPGQGLIQIISFLEKGENADDAERFGVTFEENGKIVVRGQTLKIDQVALVEYSNDVTAQISFFRVNPEGKRSAGPTIVLGAQKSFQDNLHEIIRGAELKMPESDSILKSLGIKVQAVASIPAPSDIVVDFALKEKKSPRMDEGLEVQGVVKKYSDDLGFAFITGAKLGDIYIPPEVIKKSGYEKLEYSQLVIAKLRPKGVADKSRVAEFIRVVNRAEASPSLGHFLRSPNITEPQSRDFRDFSSRSPHPASIRRRPS